MNLDASSSLDFMPLLLKLLLHLSPEHERVVIYFFYFCFSLLLEKEQTEASLNNSCFLHKEPELRVCGVCLVHAPALLYGDGGKFGSFGSFEHARGNLDYFADFIFVGDAIEELFVARFVLMRVLGL